MKTRIPIEIKDTADIRLALALLDMPHNQFARLIGIHEVTLSRVIHKRWKLSEPVRSKIEQGLAELASNPPAERPAPIQRVARQ